MQRLHALAFATLLLAPTARASALEGDLEPLVREQVQQAGGLELAELWERARGLRDLAEADGGALDPVLDRLLDDADTLSPEGVLLVAACRLEATELDTEALVEALTELLASGDTDLAVSAAELLGAKNLKAALSKTQRGSLVEALLEVAKDELRQPALRLAASRSAYRMGGGRDRSSARREMRAFLESSDSNLKSLGALSLGSIGEPIHGELRTELERLAGLPGERGALASAYLKQEDIKRDREDRYRRLDRLFEEKRLPDELQTVNAVLRMIEQMHLDGDKFDREELIGAALDGMLEVLDEHSTFMEPEIFTRFHQDLEAEYGGIGAYVGIDTVEDGLFTITKPIYSGPAYKAGLMTDDKIVRIDDWPTYEHGESKPVDDIIKKLKGRPGTQVRLYVWRRGMDPDLITRPTEDMVVELERALIEIPAVSSQMLPGKVGLISLSTFSRVASQEVAAAAEALMQQGMRALVFDMRNNSGGLLPEAINVADIFLPAEKVVVKTNSRVERSEVHVTRLPALVPKSIPMAVLVNRFSASAAEIVAGALQDHERAELIGERTFGKGSVQVLEMVDGHLEDEFRDENGNYRYDTWEEIVVDHDGDGEFDFAPRVKITIAEYLLPSGRSIHRRIDRDRNLVAEGGIQPDEEVRLPRIEGWRWEERLRIRNEQHARDYADRLWEQHAELFTQLAEGDGKDASRYPEFDDFYTSLATTLPEDDVRRILRVELRRRVQDQRGVEFPFADYQEDPQVQAAITAALTPTGVSPSEIDAYHQTFTVTEKTRTQPRTIVAADLPDEVEAARERLNAARRGDVELSDEDLEKLLSILASLDE